jgi:dTDP-4-amino-4,6-dideoxygalactose transaminase
MASNTVAAPKKQQFPFLDLKAQYETIRQEAIAAVTRVMDHQHFILGPEVEKFEKEIGSYIGTEFAIGCASGSDALLLSLMALDCGAGDEVVTVPFTFVATAGSIARLGAKPVFVDIDPVTYNLDPDKLERAITSKTKAIMPVHLFGLPADMDRINTIASKHGIPVIEDAAQAIGSKLNGRMIGTIGQMGCFSFFPSKNLGGGGDGGLITTNDAELAKKLKVLRVHGSPRKYEYQLLGMNSRLDAIQAAILSVKLPHLDSWADGRQRNAERYRALFAECRLNSLIGLPEAPTGYHHIYNQFTIRCKERDSLKKYLADEGIPTEIYYPFPLHTQPAFQGLGYRHGDFPETEKAATQALSLPIYPELTEDQQRAVVTSIAGFYNR